MTKQTIGDLGPLEPLLADPAITEILVDGHDRIYVERNHKLEDVPAGFRDDDHLLDIINRIAAAMGRRVDESRPMVDLRLPDGSRVNIIIPPIALNGPSMVIRKFTAAQAITVDDLMRFGVWDESMRDFLRACVHGMINVAVSGGAGSGKTALLNIIAGMIPNEERIVTLELASELRLSHKRVIRLEARPANLEGKGEVTLSDLVINALKMRPDRLILGDAHGEEVLHMLAAMNTGHDGSLLTLHANSPRDALARLEVMASFGNPSIPLLSLRETIASAIGLIVHIERLRDGSRKIVKVTEVQGMQGDVITLADLFVFQQTGIEDGKIAGRFAATGQIPKLMNRLRDRGVQLSMELFTPS